MTITWRIALLYLARLAQSPATLLFLLAVPFTLATIEYAVFGPAKTAVQAPPTDIALVDADASKESAELCKCLNSGLAPDEVRMKTFASPLAAQNAIGKGIYGALILIPRGFGVGLASGRPSTVHLHLSANVGAAVAENLLETCTNLSVLASPAQFSSVSVEHTAQTVKAAPASSSAFFVETLPGLAIFAVLFLSQTMAGILWRDRHSVSQKRLWCAPVNGWHIALGGLLYMIVGMFTMLTIIGLAARVAFGVESSRVPLLVLDALAFSICAAGAQILLGALTKSEQGAKGISSVGILLLSLLGGAFIPLNQYPGALLWLAHAMPNGAAVAAVSAILKSAGAWKVASPLLTVWAWAFVLGTAGLLGGSRRANA